MKISMAHITQGGTMKLVKLGRMKSIHFFMTVVFCFVVFANAFAEEQHFSGQATQKEVIEHEKNIGTGPLARLNRGFVNVFTAPLELIDKPREEVKKTNPVYGVVPGIVKGVGWCAVRATVGVWEVLTFWLRDDTQPHLEPMDLEWLTA